MPPRDFWTERDVQLLMEMTGRFPTHAIAERLGRTQTSIRDKLKSLREHDRNQQSAQAQGQGAGA